MRGWLFASALAAGLMLVSWPAAAQDEGRIERDVSEAKRLLDQGRPEEALVRLQRAIKEGERVLEEQPETMGQLSAFAGVVALDVGRVEDAERHFRRSYGLTKRFRGDGHPKTAQAARNLAAALAASGRYKEAESLLAESLIIAKQNEGDANPETATLYFELGNLHRAAGQYAKAEADLRNAVRLREVTGPEPALAEAVDALGSVLQRQLRLAEAEALHRRAVSLAERDPRSRNRAVYLNNAATAVEGQGRLAEAGELYQAALGLSAGIDGTASISYAVLLSNLGRTQYQLEYFVDAEALLRRATTIFETRLRTDHPDYCLMLASLALAQLELQQVEIARNTATRSVNACKKHLGPTHPDMVAPLNALGRAAMSAGDVKIAADAFRSSLHVAEFVNGVDHPTTALALHNLAGVLLAAGDETAFDLLRRAAAIAERTGGALDALRATTLEVLASALLKNGQAGQALIDIRRASSLTRERLERALPRRGGVPGSAWADLRKRFAFHATVAVQAAAKVSQADAARLYDEAFVAAELARGSSAARAIAQMASRFASADTSLARLVRERQDAGDQWQQHERRFLQMLGQANTGSAETAEMRSTRKAIADQITAIDRRLKTEFPAYVELANPEPPSIAATRALLRPGEGLLTYLVREEETLIWYLDSTTLIVRRQPVGAAALAERVARLRASLEPNASGEIIEFDSATSADLYRLLIEPLGGALSKAKHLFVVDDGPLRSIPFAVLSPGTRNPADTPNSLISNAALSTLPSVSALRALRRFAQPARSSSAFVGFGDPLFGGDFGIVSGRRSTQRWRGGHVELDALKSLPRLPEAADELRTIAQTLGGGDVFLAEAATEGQVKRLELERYRIVAFATHSFDVANSDDGSAEPGLALTPPPVQTAEDDGLLTVSEVAQLRLDADLVILSACSTAAADGSPGSEALSGLARAFIFAGSRAILASHWPIESNAAVKLTTGMIEALRRDPKIGRAEALRRAMLALARESRSAHPFYWAPFVLVGEGAF